MIAARAALGAACALAACQGPAPRRVPAPTEDVAVPDDRRLAAEVEEALLRQRRALSDRGLDAADPGELREHATVSQLALERQAPSLERLLRVGDDLFAYAFRPPDGLGNGLGVPPGAAVPHAVPLAGGRAAPNLRRVAAGDFGGPEAMACADCHAVGGDDGAGSLTQAVAFRGDGDRWSSGDVRTAPAVLGLGPVQRLAEEMTARLAQARAEAVAQARARGAAVTVPLSAKGQAFGTLTARPDGSVDAAGVTGVAADLVVRPFGWKGHQATLRGMIREAFRLHLGVLAMVDQEDLREGAQPAALLGDGPWADADADGVTIELDDGMVSSMVAYLAQLEVPVVRPPDEPGLRARFERGARAFAEVGCAGCHPPSLPLDDPRLVSGPEERAHRGGRGISVDVARDGNAPKIAAAGRGYAVELFSDLRRHDLGEGLASPRPQPAAGGEIPARVWLTRPLWGLADTAPYLHDGRAATVDAAIRAHGGEAAASRAAYVAASVERQRDLAIYLLSLARTPRLVAP